MAFGKERPELQKPRIRGTPKLGGAGFALLLAGRILGLR